MADKVPYYQLRQSAAVVILKILFIQFAVTAVSVLLHVMEFWFAGADVGATIQTLIILTVIAIQMINATFLVVLMLSWLNTTYTITPSEIIIQRGTLTLQRQVFKNSRIEEVDVRQTLMGKMFDYGTIKFYNPVLREEVHIMNIGRPIQYSKIIKKFDPDAEVMFLPSHAEDNHYHHPQ